MKELKESKCNKTQYLQQERMKQKNKEFCRNEKNHMQKKINLGSAN